jgi:hypothetical protein
MKKALIAVSAVLAASLLAGPAPAGAGSTSAEVTPLTLKIVSLDGRPKLKAARKLTAVMSCNRDCRVSVRYILRMPAGTLRNGGARNLFDGAFWAPAMVLNNTATRYLRDNYRGSSFKVVVRAKDLETGQNASKTRIFRFYR